MKKYVGEPVGLVITGACGRMGSIVARLAASSSNFVIKGLIERKNHPSIGSKIILDGISSTEKTEILDSFPDHLSPEDIVIDFSLKEALMAILEESQKRQLKLVCGTTGLDAFHLNHMKSYAETRAVFYDTNMSYGIAVLKHLLQLVKPLLPESFDAEIIEFHHRDKKDFPSGTALSMARQLTSEKNIITGRGREAKRNSNSVHIHSVRAGGIRGEHHAFLSSDEETLTLSHSALTRDVFARGALAAAMYLSKKEKGFYSMKNLLEEKYA